MVCNYFYFRQTGANICSLKPAHFYRKSLQFSAFPPYLLENLLLLLEGTELGLFSKPYKEIIHQKHTCGHFFLDPVLHKLQVCPGYL